MPYGGAKVDKSESGLGADVIISRQSFFQFFFRLTKVFTLKEQGYFAVGTIFDNRIGKCPMKTPKILAKRYRGSFAFHLVSTRWNNRK